MPVVIYNAVSLDGFISGPDKYEDWISTADEAHFEKHASESEIVIMGRNTYEQNTNLYPIPNKENVVFTRDADTRSAVTGITFTNTPPEEYVTDNAQKRIFVAGGGQLNGSLLKAGVVTDIIISLHPVILGEGVRQFADITFTDHTILHRQREEHIGEGVVKIHYTVTRK